MFLKSSNLMFMLILINSTILAISCNSWVISWLALEVNLMMLIPLLINKINLNSTSSAIKYFLVQTFASIIIITSFIVIYYSLYSPSMSMSNDAFTLAMIMKSGIPPFQFWLPQVLEFTSLTQSFLILTWQKIAPFMFLSYSNSNLLFLFLAVSAFVGALGGLNQNPLLGLVAYSSMIHGAWMISGVVISVKTWMVYFLLYSLIMLGFFLWLYIFKVKKVSDLMKMYLTNTSKLTFSMNILSMGGLPPFLGFMGKLVVIKKMILMKLISSMVILLSASFVSLLYYTRLCYSIFMASYNASKKNVKMNTTKTHMFLWMSLFMNTISPLMVLLT
uniref:NADH-ubiquinone oxidoreductase chain 2 n=1 Tax=Dicyrtomina saundersi TaxID=438492 RepID=A0A516EZS5_9HEXA|nr:NADH dehydrogenase subunit 2 [Dicyrtomina saundersi]QDO72009.1 NADH dehydrogenase subunit 2 [Dicyrtomina saundersi]